VSGAGTGNCHLPLFPNHLRWLNSHPPDWAGCVRSHLRRDCACSEGQVQRRGRREDLRREFSGFANAIPAEALDAVPGDKTDNRILECAVATGSGTIVTGDRHLLSLGSLRGTRRGRSGRGLAPRARRQPSNISRRHSRLFSDCLQLPATFPDASSRKPAS
jgi:hypothetical protein